MPDMPTTPKAEIARPASREVWAELVAMKRVVASCRSEITELQRRLEDQGRKIAAMEKTAASGPRVRPAVPDAETPDARSSPKWLRSHRIQFGLTARRAHRVRTLYEEGKGVEFLAKKYGVSQSAIYAVLSGKTWKDAGGPIKTKGSRKRQTRKPPQINEECVREARRLFEEGQ